MHTIVETPEFLRQSKKVGLSDEERSVIIAELASNPMAGNEISGTGGMRKLRIAASGRGKSGGYRIITFYTGVRIPVFLITIYAKNQKENISNKEKNIMQQLSSMIVQAYSRRKNHE